MKHSYNDLLSYLPNEHPRTAPIDPALEARILSRTRKNLRLRRRAAPVLRRVLIAVAAIALLSVTALGVSVFLKSHTRALLETGPESGGTIPQAVSETAEPVIAAESQIIDAACISNGVSMTLKSILGMSTDTYSFLYLTLHLDIQASELPGVPSDWGSYDMTLEIDGTRCGYDGAETAVVLEDGTIAMLYTMHFREPINGRPFFLEVNGYGMNTKEDRTIYCDGVWKFQFTPELTEGLTLTPQTDLLAYPVYEIYISPFAVAVLYDDAPDALWEVLSDETLEAIDDALYQAYGREAVIDSYDDVIHALETYHTDLALSQRELDALKDYFENEPGMPTSLVLSLSDGTQQELKRLWFYQLDHLHKTAVFQIPSPVDLSQISELTLDQATIDVEV